MTINIVKTSINGLPPVPKPDDAYATYKAQVIGSKTAQYVFSRLEKAPQKFGVLIVNSGSGVDSMYVPPFNCSDDGHDGGFAILNVDSPLVISDQTLPLGISLIHELGHAVQWLDAPDRFETLFKQAQGQIDSSSMNIVAATKWGGTTVVVKGNRTAQLVIENSNVAAHEATTCVELDLPYRSNYEG